MNDAFEPGNPTEIAHQQWKTAKKYNRDALSFLGILAVVVTSIASSFSSLSSFLSPRLGTLGRVYLPRAAENATSFLPISEGTLTLILGFYLLSGSALVIIAYLHLFVISAISALSVLTSTVENLAVLKPDDHIFPVETMSREREFEEKLRVNQQELREKKVAWNDCTASIRKAGEYHLTGFLICLSIVYGWPWMISMIIFTLVCRLIYVTLKKLRCLYTLFDDR